MSALHPALCPHGLKGVGDGRIDVGRLAQVDQVVALCYHDEEMAQLLSLQNAYASNARVMSTVKQMFDALLQV